MPNDTPLSDEFYDRWHHLLRDVEIKEIPLRLVSKVLISLDEDDDPVIFDVGQLLKDGLESADIEEQVQELLVELGEEVAGIDFHIDIHAVAREVGEKVSKILDK